MTQTNDPEASKGPLVRVQRVIIDACPDPVSFVVERGAAVVLVEDGARAGSVIARLLARVSPPRAGRVEIFGCDPAEIADVARAGLRRRLGSIPRDLALEGDLSVFDTVALAAVAAGRRPADYTQPVMELISWVGLGRREDVAADSLDDAGRRRLALARALVNRPELLIADEPAGGLEGDARRGLLRLIAELHGAGTSVLMTSGDEALAERSGADVVRLTHGAPGVPVAGAA